MLLASTSIPRDRLERPEISAQSLSRTETTLWRDGKSRCIALYQCNASELKKKAAPGTTASLRAAYTGSLARSTYTYSGSVGLPQLVTQAVLRFCPVFGHC
jgi:hypothetical protein